MSKFCVITLFLALFFLLNNVWSQDSLSAHGERIGDTHKTVIQNSGFRGSTLHTDAPDDDLVKVSEQTDTKKKVIPTRVLVRAVANDAKLIFDKVGGARIFIKDVESGRILVNGIQKGTSGDTKLIMIDPIKRDSRVFDTEGAAGFLATLNLEKPTLVEITAEGPLKYPHSMQRASKTLLLVPGRDVLGEGIVLRLHGFIVDLVPSQPTQTIKGKILDVTATVMMLCSCTIEADGLWDANKIQVVARIIRENGTVLAEIPLKYAGVENTFSGKLSTNNRGRFSLQILAMDTDKANFGMIQKSLAVK